ncbi:hypothetical protein GALL_504950 [mine drainage metagenome]|uniref:Uncharacterized protein n=1 Tax=mine drainage metagenome TaxID=410659 RepID=A0A1J5PRK7_9ZZZZ
MLVAVPKLARLIAGDLALQRTRKDDPAGPGPSTQLDPSVGHLPCSDVLRSLPGRFGHFSEGLAHVRRQFEFEQKVRSISRLLVPGHHRVMAQPKVSSVQPNLPFPQPPLCVRHRLMPLRRRDRVPGPEAVRRAHPRARHHREQRVEAPAPGLARIVADRRALLVPVLGLYRRVPVQHHRLRQRSPQWLRVARDPLRAQRWIHRLEEPSYRVAAHHRFHPEDLWNRRILSHPFYMREAPPVRQCRQNETLKHVVHRRGVRTAPLHRTIFGEFLHDAYMLGIRCPRHKPSERRERVICHR